jgi:hypothetical protein
MVNEAMKDFDRSVRLFVYGHFLEHERPPTLEETAVALSATPAEVRSAYVRLGEGRALVVDDEHRVRMAMPFSADTSRFRVSALGHSWWAPCAWDALAIPAMLKADARISTTCGDCGEPVTLGVRGGGVRGAGEIVHFAVAAAHWWDDIFYT